MAQRLKRWESPRKEGRNDKGKGGSARQRQLKKRTQMLRQKLKDQGSNDSQGQHKKSENHDSRSFFIVSKLTIHHSPFTIHHSPFTIHHSPFTIHHSPFT
ncbi:hypothetical protein [Chamaesiphon sp.]|uniref:hypothetical protein n=1 Tax=Chamaesiphon sp. TaxID=2814140 RepID=UPI0035942B2E